MKRINLNIALTLGVLISLISACSTHKNTATNRWWQAFNTRYNVYYNGKVAYIEGSLEKEKGNKDNFTELIPLYTVANKTAKEIGKGNFETAITKSQKAIRLHSINKKPAFNKQRKKNDRDKEWLSRKEYNPFLWKAWLLMGRSQFYIGAFDEAAATFSYMARRYKTQPAIAQRAQAWLAKCYIEQGWMYDAEEVIRAMQRDSVHWRAQKEWNYTLADYYIRTQDYVKAVTYLRKVIKTEMRRIQKAREWFLLAQLYEELNNTPLAFQAYKKVIRLNPPYELAFNARIAMSEVMAKDKASSMISKLKRMASSDKNKDLKDRVYYALGNVFLAQKDTTMAIDAYEKGRKESTQSGPEKGVLMLKLGNLYWQRERYNKAKDCYTEAVGLLDKERVDYEELSFRSQVLDQLVPFTDEVALQDSLQALVALPEKERLAIIDQAIATYKKKEKEEKRNAQATYAQDILQQNSGYSTNTPTPFVPQNTTTDANLWYFYNPQVVNQGKATFQKLWGNRANKDNWQRSNTTIVKTEDEDQQMNNEQETTNEMPDSLALPQASPTQEKSNDPHQREFYLSRLPFTQEQKEESIKKRNEALFQAAVIFQDKLNNDVLSEKAFMRLLGQKELEENHKPDIYYHLFLLYSRQKNTLQAKHYIEKLQQEFPENNLTKLITNPYFAENAGLGVQLEDSLYAQTYNQFKANNTQEVLRNVTLASERFPFGANTDKFLFLGALSKLSEGKLKESITDLQTLVATYPDSKLSTFAGNILNGVKSGKKIQSTQFSLNEMWAERSALLNENDTTIKKQFVKDSNIDFLFTIVYHPDSIDKNKLLYAIARYNFMNYPVRNFGIATTSLANYEQMIVSGFHNYQEVLEYARGFYQQSAIVTLLKQAEIVLISEQNANLLEKGLSLKAYQEFYQKHFATIKPLLNGRLKEPETLVVKPSTTTSLTEAPTNTEKDNGTIFMPLEDEDDTPTGGTIIPLLPNVLTPNTNVNPNNGTTIIIPPTPQSPTTPAQTPNNGRKVASKVNHTTTNNRKTNATAPVKVPTKPTNYKQQMPNTTTKTGIYFGDGFGEPINNNSTKDAKGSKTKAKRTDLDDDYYELEGF